LSDQDQTYRESCPPNDEVTPSDTLIMIVDRFESIVNEERKEKSSIMEELQKTKTMLANCKNYSNQTQCKLYYIILL